MGVSGARLTYRHVIEYGMRKVRLRFDRLFLQAFMAGVFIGMAGNACISLAGGLPTDPADPRAVSPVIQKFIFASIFPVAFIAIITTGAELFTGNTMTMLICLFERRVTVLQLLRNWCGSLLGNWLGTLFSAYFLTYLCCHFEQQPYFGYLNAIAEHKTSHGWGGCFLRGVGCNTWVCLAVWFVLACDDWAGKILALWFPIVCFVLSSYEHIIANMYTLQLCAMFGVSTPLSAIIVYNFLPTFLGNLVGGCGLVGAVYFYNFYPGAAEEAVEAEGHFEFDGHRPCGYGKDHGLLKQCDEGGKGNYLGGGTGGSTPQERGGFLLKDGIPAMQLPCSGAGGGGGYCPAGAATAAECSEKSSNNCSNDKDSTGAMVAAPSGGSAARPDKGERSGRNPGYISLSKNIAEEADLEKGGDPVEAVGSASAETWAGETSTNAGCGYSTDNTTVTGREATSATLLKPAAVHAAAADFEMKQNAASERWRGSAVRFDMRSLSPVNEPGHSVEIVIDSSAKSSPGVELTAAGR